MASGTRFQLEAPKRSPKRAAAAAAPAILVSQSVNGPLLLFVLTCRLENACVGAHTHKHALILCVCECHLEAHTQKKAIFSMPSLPQPLPSLLAVDLLWQREVPAKCQQQPTKALHSELAMSHIILCYVIMGSCYSTNLETI